MIGVADALYPLVNLPLYNQLYNHTFTRLAGAVFLLSGFYGALALAAFGYPSHLTYPSYPHSFRLWPGPTSESSGHNSLVSKFHSENDLNYSEDHLTGKTPGTMERAPILVLRLHLERFQNVKLPTVYGFAIFRIQNFTDLL